MKYLQRELHLLNDLCAVGFFDKDLEQGNIRFHILENLLFKGTHPGPIPPLQGIRDKEYVARITGEHIVHIPAEVRIVLFQNFCLGCLSARSVQLSERGVCEGGESKESFILDNVAKFWAVVERFPPWVDGC